MFCTTRVYFVLFVYIISQLLVLESWWLLYLLKLKHKCHYYKTCALKKNNVPSTRDLWYPLISYAFNHIFTHDNTWNQYSNKIWHRYILIDLLITTWLTTTSLISSIRAVIPFITYTWIWNAWPTWTLITRYTI